MSDVVWCIKRMFLWWRVSSDFWVQLLCLKKHVLQKRLRCTVNVSQFVDFRIIDSIIFTVLGSLNQSEDYGFLCKKRTKNVKCYQHEFGEVAVFASNFTNLDGPGLIGLSPKKEYRLSWHHHCGRILREVKKLQSCACDKFTLSVFQWWYERELLTHTIIEKLTAWTDTASQTITNADQSELDKLPLIVWSYLHPLALSSVTLSSHRWPSGQRPAIRPSGQHPAIRPASGHPASIQPSGQHPAIRPASSTPAIRLSGHWPYGRMAGRWSFFFRPPALGLGLGFGLGLGY